VFSFVFFQVIDALTINSAIWTRKGVESKFAVAVRVMLKELRHVVKDLRADDAAEFDELMMRSNLVVDQRTEALTSSEVLVTIVAFW